ncbi:unnamed protein product [Trichobilharzia regenti]|nr:unnamed protein product [Trichobilharzia regenti]
MHAFYSLRYSDGNMHKLYYCHHYFWLSLQSSLLLTLKAFEHCRFAVYRRCRCPYSNSESLMLSENDDLISEENVSLVEDIDVRQHRHLVESLPLSRLKEQSS